MNLTEVMAALKKKGNAQTKKILASNGCPEPLFGVKVSDLKVLVKKIKTNTPLARELYKTGNGDAMYLAGLVGSGAELSRAELEDWARRATWHWIMAYTVPWMAVEHPEGWKTALAWIDSPAENLSTSGWSTLSAFAVNKPDEELDLKALEKLLDRVVKTIGSAPNRTKAAMNGFVIAVGGQVKPLTKKALEAAARMGKVEVDHGDRSCETPDAADYIRHIIKMGRHGKKRATVKC